MKLTLEITSFQANALKKTSRKEFSTAGGTIGRGKDNTWVLPDPERFLSTKHVQIVYQSGEFLIRDTSINGVFINRGTQPLGKGNSVRLNDGDVFRCGEYEIVAHIDQESATPVPDNDPFAFEVFEHRDTDPFADAAEADAATSPGETMDPLKLLSSDEPAPLDDSFRTPEDNCSAMNNTCTPPRPLSDETPFVSPEEDLPASSTEGQSPGVGQIPEDWDKTGIDAIKEEQVQFTSYYPAELKPELWYTLLAYVHVESTKKAVREDSQNRLGRRPKAFRKVHGKATTTIARGTEIVVVPELLGCSFNPPRARVLWLEDWHRVEFRMRASQGLPGFALNTAVNGRLAFYVGPILVAEVKLRANFSDDIDSIEVERAETSCLSELYQAVFVSYSHSDTQIIHELEKAYVAIGMKYLCDINVLRSGEKWNPTLLKKIEEADIFQLCWSRAAKQSTYVEQEWRHALKLQRQSFIRPVYWETPIPEPPGELV